jgi:cephalosporin-C deacetylase-like acetyl esterase
MSGHSFGGATSLLVGNSDPRIKAVLTHDPWLFPISPDLDCEAFKNQISKEMDGPSEK